MIHPFLNKKCLLPCGQRIDFDMQEEKILDVLSQYDEVFIYGAGRNALKLYNYLCEKSFIIAGFVVSKKEGNPDTLRDCPVIEIVNFVSSADCVVISSIPYLGNGYNDIFDKCIKNNISNIIFFSKKSLDALLDKQTALTRTRKMERLAAILSDNGYHLHLYPYTEINHTILETARDGKVYHWRIQDDLFYDAGSFEEICAQKTILEEYMEQYGNLCCLDREAALTTTAIPKVKIYLVKSIFDKKVGHITLDNIYEPIQAGAFFTDKRICELTDDLGDNISDKNLNYSEGTAVYWVWKNAIKEDYIGICQYRRRMDVDDNIGKLLKAGNVDILTSSPTFLSCDIRTLFANFLPPCDIEVFLQSIKDCAEDYYEVAKEFFDSRFYPPCNLFVMRKRIFQRYADTVFRIVFGVEKYYADRNIIREDRYIGFLIECFLGIFIMKHKDEYRSRCVDMIFLHST